MGLKQDLDKTPVSKLNIRPAVTINQSATVREAVKKIRNASLGCVVVTNDDGKAVGLFTEALLRHELNDSPTILDDPISKQMAERFPWVLPSDPARDILDSMEAFNIRFLAVLDEDKNVLGLTGQKTLVEFIAETFPQEVLTHDPTGHTVSQSKEGA